MPYSASITGQSTPFPSVILSQRNLNGTFTGQQCHHYDNQVGRFTEPCKHWPCLGAKGLSAHFTPITRQCPAMGVLPTTRGRCSPYNPIFIPERKTELENEFNSRIRLRIYSRFPQIWLLLLPNFHYACSSSVFRSGGFFQRSRPEQLR